MAIWRRAARRDANEGEIVAALEAAGAKVWRLSLPFDLLVGVQGRFVILECKAGKDKLRPGQEKDLADCRYRNVPVYVVRTAEEALQAVGAKH